MKINAFATPSATTPLEPYTYEVTPATGVDCIIRVLACGICHSDLSVMDNEWGVSAYPAVPGHEVVGEIVELGDEIRHLHVGDRVGVGWQMGACLECQDCLRGQDNLCDENQALIIAGKGGFADYLKVDARFAFKLPETLSTEVAGPLLCGGVTVYAGLRNAGMTSGQEIGVIGLGGLGHLAVQFASKLGNRVTAFTTSEDKAEFAHELGAHHVVVVPPGASPPLPLRKLNIILDTVPHELDWAAYLSYLDSNGTFAIVGVPDAPLTLPVFPLIFKQRRVMGSVIGSRAMINEMLAIAAEYDIKPIVETFPMSEIHQAMERVRSNKVRYRAVLLNP